MNSDPRATWAEHVKQIRPVPADCPSRVAVTVRKATAKDYYQPEDYRTYQRRVLGSVSAE